MTVGSEGATGAPSLTEDGVEGAGAVTAACVKRTLGDPQPGCAGLK